MQTATIVEGFDVIEDGSASLGLSGEALMVDQLVFEAAKEALDKGIIVAVTWTTHGGDQAVLGEHLSVGRAGELASAIGVEDESRARLALSYGHS